MLKGVLYLTAYGALIDIAAIGKGWTIVIPAASSSVGMAGGGDTAMSYG